MIDEYVGRSFRSHFPISLLSVTDYHATPFDWEQARVNEAPFGYRSPAAQGNDHDFRLAEETCPTRASVLGLAVTCALLVVLYVCTVFCVCIRRTAMARSACSSEPTSTFLQFGTYMW